MKVGDFERMLLLKKEIDNLQCDLDQNKRDFNSVMITKEKICKLGVFFGIKHLDNCRHINLTINESNVKALKNIMRLQLRRKSEKILRLKKEFESIK